MIRHGNRTNPKSKLMNRLSEICLALPEAAREVMGDHAAFSVRGKKFAYFLNDHHGDGIVSVCFKTEPGENEVLVASDPKRFYSPAYIGPRGWVGLRLDQGVSTGPRLRTSSPTATGWPLPSGSPRSSPNRRSEYSFLPLSATVQHRPRLFSAMHLRHPSNSTDVRQYPRLFVPLATHWLSNSSPPGSPYARFNDNDGERIGIADCAAGTTRVVWGLGLGALPRGRDHLRFVVGYPDLEKVEGVSQSFVRSTAVW